MMTKKAKAMRKSDSTSFAATRPRQFRVKAVTFTFTPIDAAAREFRQTTCVRFGTRCVLRDPITRTCLRSEPIIIRDPCTQSREGRGIFTLQVTVPSDNVLTNSIRLVLSNSQRAAASQFLSRISLFNLQQADFSNGVISTAINQSLVAYRNSVQVGLIPISGVQNAQNFARSLSLFGRFTFRPSTDWRRVSKNSRRSRKK